MLKGFVFSSENITLDIEKRLNPLLLMFSAIFFAFSITNYLQGSISMSISDAVLASAILIANIVLQKRLIPAMWVVFLILIIVTLAVSSELVLSGSISSFLYYYGVIPFYVFYIAGRRIGVVYTILLLAVVWLLGLLSSFGMFVLQYSIEELLFFTPLLFFSAFCAWMFEADRQENQHSSYEKGLRHETLMQAIEEVYYRVDMQGTIEQIGNGITKFTDFSPEEVIGQPIAMLYADQNARDAYVRALKEHGKVTNYLIDIKGKSNQIVNISMNSRIAFDEDKKPLYIEGMFRDVSKDFQMKQEKKDHVEQLEQLNTVDAFLAKPDLVQGIEDVMKQLGIIFSAQRAFLVPFYSVKAEEDGYTHSFLAQQDQDDDFDALHFLQQDEVSFYFTSMFGQEKTLHQVFDDKALFSAPLLHEQGIESHAMILLRTNMDNYWLLGLHNIAKSPLKKSQKQLFLEISKRIAATLNQLLLQRDLESAVVKAEVASKAKGEFVATISHELRTPLHGIIGLLDLMAQEAHVLPDEQRKNLTLAQASTQVLRSLIDDVLDLSKIESGNVEIQKQSFYLKQALVDALIPFVMKAREKGIVLHLEMRDVAEMIEGDVQRLRQVLLNLVGNAIKFTAQGYVRIVVSQDEDMLFINIEDSGIGIDKDRQIDVFKPFAQVHNAAVLGDNLQEKGTGLGTTISQYFITMMGGELTLQSEPSVGSTMTIRLPLQQVGQEKVSLDLQVEDLIDAPQEHHAAELKPQSTKPIMKSWRILLAEDDPVGRRVAVKRLERAGFTVETVSDGLQAYAQLQTRSFDLLLTDIRMPGLTGLQLTKKIRENERKQGLSPMLIIGLSAYALEDVKRDALVAGMDSFISKPVDMTALIALLESKYEQHE